MVPRLSAYTDVIIMLFDLPLSIWCLVLLTDMVRCVRLWFVVWGSELFGNILSIYCYMKDKIINVCIRIINLYLLL